MKHKLLIVIALAMTVVGTAVAQRSKPQRVYMFGVATTFNDSTVFLTDIQQLDSVFLTKSGIMSERSIYSYQLETYLQTQRERPNATTAVFWATKRKKVERSFIKVRRRFLNDTTTHLIPLQADEFRFTLVEHIDIE